MATQPSDVVLPTTVHATAVRLPVFAPNETMTWFRRAETQFRLKHITVSSTMSDYVLEALPENVFRRIASWLNEQPDLIPYQELKVHLLSVYSISSSERAKRILDMPGQPLGDRTATQVWEEIVSLCRLPVLDIDDAKPSEIDLKKEIWLQCLPSHIRSLLHGAATSKIDHLTKKADALIDASRMSGNMPDISTVQENVLPSSAGITRSPSVSADRTQLDKSDQTPDISAIRPRPADSYKQRPRFGKLTSSGICTYHLRFGERAKSCVDGCTWAKKRGKRPLVVDAAAHSAAPPDQTYPPKTNISIATCNNTSLAHPGFLIKDEISGHEFLVDTGAFKSIFPAAQHEKLDTSTCCVELIAANGTTIRTHGEREIPLRFHGRRYDWIFILADVRRPLLGADFLSHNHLMVDVSGRKLIDTVSFRPFSLATSNAQDINEITTCKPSAGRYTNLISEFTEVFKPELRFSTNVSAKHGVYHHIETTGPPVYSRFRRLRPDRLKAAKSAFWEMERMGICSKAASPWASPLHLTPKTDGSWRPCGDYRRLNMITVPDHYPMPNAADLTSGIGNARIFSKLDLLKGYFQVPVHPDDVPKTAIITPFGSYVFRYSTFGLRNSGATFQRMMDQLFGRFSFCVAYVDDILVFSENHSDHSVHLRQVLQVLQINGLIVRPDKCVFGATRVEFLGYDISTDGIRPLKQKVEAIINFPRPTTIRNVQEFLGVLNYYHRFIPHAASICTPLYKTIANKPKCLLWGVDQDTAFQAAKDAIVSAVTLVYPLPEAPMYLVTDASNIAIGAVLEQEVRGQRRPLAFFSRKLRQPERRYSTFDRELLAVHLAIRHFRHLLEGTSYTICTDHKPLVSALIKPSDAWSDRQRRQLSAIAETSCTIQHLPGRDNVVADTLSRVEISPVVMGIDYAALSTEQQSDPETTVLTSNPGNLELKSIPYGDNQILCDVSTGRSRPIVPKSFRQQVFNIVHGLSHPSIRMTTKLATNKFVWNSIRKDIRTWTRGCAQCQRSKVHRHTKSVIGRFPPPTRRFAHIHVDIVGPLPPSEGFRYLFTIVDRSTRWLEAVPMENATTSACISALLHTWISRFGMPDDITSDRGAVFTSDLWSALARLLGTSLHRTTSYHPQANGMVERAHRTLKAALTARCAGDGWTSHLPWTLLGLRTTPKEGLCYSSAEMVYGEPLVVPGEFFPTNPDHKDCDISRLRKIADKFAPSRPTCSDPHQKPYVPDSLQSCEFVFIRHDASKPPLSPAYKGPFQVLLRKEKAYFLQLGNRKDWVSIDRLKAAYGSDVDKGIYTRAGRLSKPPKLIFAGEYL